MGVWQVCSRKIGTGIRVSFSETCCSTSERVKTASKGYALIESKVKASCKATCRYGALQVAVTGTEEVKGCKQYTANIVQAVSKGTCRYGAVQAAIRTNPHLPMLLGETQSFPAAQGLKTFSAKVCFLSTRVDMMLSHDSLQCRGAPTASGTGLSKGFVVNSKLSYVESGLQAHQTWKECDCVRTGDSQQR